MNGVLRSLIKFVSGQLFRAPCVSPYCKVELGAPRSHSCVSSDPDIDVLLDYEPELL